MSTGLPDTKSMWMRAFYGFGPEHDGYVGWTKEIARDRILREIRDGDLILIYGSGSAETGKSTAFLCTWVCPGGCQSNQGCREILARGDAAKDRQRMERAVELRHPHPPRMAGR